MTPQQQSVLAWLKDAHAMEVGGVVTLENHAAAAQGYPDVQAKLHEHAQTTRRHADLIERSLERLGGHPSALKEALGGVVSKVAGIANLPAQDTVVKNALGDFAAENFEIACYRSLIAAAEGVGDEQTAIVCRQILQDEEAMASWLESQIPMVTQQFLAEQTGEAGQSIQAQVLDKAKETVKELGEQGQELASKAKEKGKGALLTSGALLVGAGAALLVTQAILKGSDGKEQSEQDDKDAYEGVRAGDQGMDSAEPITALDLHTQTLDLSQPFVRDAELSAELQAGNLTRGVLEETDEFLGVGIGSVGSQSQQGTMNDTLASGIYLIEPPGDEAQDLDDLRGLDADLLDTELMSDVAPGSEQGLDTLASTEVWLIPGPYSGIGPAGYDNSGDPTGQEVYSRLTQHGQVDASSIEITIDNGEVLLEGTVDSEETKRLAEEAVQTIAGVERVQNLLQVASQDS